MALPRGVIKASPEDFVVDEIPLYEPSGEGDHLYVRFTKRNLTTDAVVRAIARACAVDARDIGVPGLKDKVGVTTQTISLPVHRKDAGAPLEERVRGVAMEGLTILDARRHANKLRTGHLAGNRFAITIRGLEDEARVAEVTSALERIGREGAPNAFGAQRFGRDGDNAERARAWLRGEWAGPRDGRARRFLWSSLQSAMFNDVLQRRVEAGTWRTPLEGDLLQKSDTGGLFLCTDVQADRERADRGELSPTGPIAGIKMRAPEGEALAIETEVTTAWLGDAFDFATVRALGEGARRALRMGVRELRVEALAAADGSPEPARAGEQGHGVRVHFVLPKGAYATTVLSGAIALDESPAPAEPPSSEDEAGG